MTEFERALARVLTHEGGYVNDPRDPGGATNRGITQRVYDAYRDRLGLQRVPVRNISSSEVEGIYRSNYWDLAKCDMLPAGVSYVVFDGAVNSGVAQSVKWLQRALGVTPDGVIGNATLAAVQNYGNLDRLVDAICDRRLAFLKALKTWKAFGKGWASRVAAVRATGKAWATGGVEAQPLGLASGASVKALISDAKPAPALAVADASTGGGIGSGGLAATLQQVQDQLSPLSYSSELIGKVVAGLIVVSAALMIGGLAYRWYAARRRKERADALDLQVTANAQPAA
ncbi:glycoside hydrolase family 108 protein [Rhizobium sp. NZLR11]|uniref:glycoside hydrolase family 108 protein n=1 Tax=Rhizobium sp. NZLR11 TaxID=2731098 RepID=UPI001C832C73|nr:glycoside hydrolase family 108 protein [Rhizobium sp. NZLR11]MBX5206678.1 glycoside hydrolase family 108 protein [Rhizobium sp. NZLR11]